MAQTISIATHKGGTGKTVTSMALGAAFARAGKTCLVVDLDPQGHSTLGLGVEVGGNEPTLRELFTEPPLPVARLIHKTHLPGLDILPSDIRLARVAQALYMRPKREELLRRGLASIRSQYAFIIVRISDSSGMCNVEDLLKPDKKRSLGLTDVA